MPEDLSRIQRYSQLSGAANEDPAGGYLMGEILDWLWRMGYGKATEGRRENALRQALMERAARTEATREKMLDFSRRANPGFSEEAHQEFVNSQLGGGEGLEPGDEQIEALIKGAGSRNLTEQRNPDYWMGEFNPEATYGDFVEKQYDRQGEYSDAMDKLYAGKEADMLGRGQGAIYDSAGRGEKHGYRMKEIEAQGDNARTLAMQKAALDAFTLNPRLPANFNPQTGEATQERNYTGSFGDFQRDLLGETASQSNASAPMVDTASTEDAILRTMPKLMELLRQSREGNRRRF